MTARSGTSRMRASCVDDPSAIQRTSRSVGVMWRVYTGEQYRAALADWDRDEADPESRRSDRYRQACYNDEAVAVADCVEAKMPGERRPLPVLVLAGAGGNGRAGLRAGIELLKRGYRVEVQLVPAPQERDRYDGYPDYCDDPQGLWHKDAPPASHAVLKDFLALDGKHTTRRGSDDVWTPCIAIDAICGRGFDGRLRGPATLWAGILWKASDVVAVDCPTGMNPDTGRTMDLTDASPALGGFTASVTVVAGGLRPVHLLREDCGRLVVVKTGVERFLGRIEYEDNTNRDYQDFFDEYGYVPVRGRRALLAQDPWPDDTVPVFTAYSEGAEGALLNSYEGIVQFLGSLVGDDGDSQLSVVASAYPSDTPVMPTIGIAGVPDCQPGTPTLVAAGAAASTACRIVADPAAAGRIEQMLPAVEVAFQEGDTHGEEIPWVLCSGDVDDRILDARMIVATRTAVLDWIHSGQRPPKEAKVRGARQVVLVIDRPTAEAALSAWGGSSGEQSEELDPVALAEELASCTRTSVLLVGPTSVYVRKLDTWIVRSGTMLTVQGAEELVAGSFAAGMRMPDNRVNAFIPLVLRARALMAMSRAEPAVACTAGSLSERIPGVLRSLRAEARMHESWAVRRWGN